MKLKLEYWDLDKLVEYPGNPRRNDHAVDALANAIDEFGFRVPVLARSNGEIVDGHLRLKAARKLSLLKVPVLLADDLTAEQVRAFRISVNQISGDWDFDLLAKELAAIDASSVDVMLTGFDPSEINRFLTGFEPQSFPDEDEREPKTTICPACGHEF